MWVLETKLRLELETIDRELAQCITGNLEHIFYACCPMLFQIPSKCFKINGHASGFV